MLYTESYTRMVINKRNFTMNRYQKLVSFIYDLIIDKGVIDQDGYWLNVNTLSQSQLGQYAALLLDYDDRDTSECFYQTDRATEEDSISHALITLLNSNNHQNKSDLADLITTNVIAKIQTNNAAHDRHPMHLSKSG